MLLGVRRSGEWNGRRWCWLLRRICRGRLLLLLLLRGKGGEDDAREGRIGVLRLPLRAADRAADPFGGWGRRGWYRGCVGCTRDGAGVLLEGDLVPEDERGILLYAYAGVRADQ